MAVTTSAWEAEQKRQTVEALSRLGSLPHRILGECLWTGKTDNSGVGVRVLDDGVDEPDEPDWISF